MKISIEISDDDAALVARFVEAFAQQAESTHGPLTIEKLAATARGRRAR